MSISTATPKIIPVQTQNQKIFSAIPDLLKRNFYMECDMMGNIIVIQSNDPTVIAWANSNNFNVA